jgi:hypothetical protein
MDMRNSVCNLSGTSSSRSLHAGMDLVSNENTEVCFSLFCRGFSYSFYFTKPKMMLHSQIGSITCSTRKHGSTSTGTPTSF